MVRFNCCMIAIIVIERLHQLFPSIEVSTVDIVEMHSITKLGYFYE